MVPMLCSVGLGMAVRFLVPIPDGITVQGWTLLSIFISTIAGAWGQLSLIVMPTLCVLVVVHAGGAGYRGLLTVEGRCCFLSFCQDSYWSLSRSARGRLWLQLWRRQRKH